MLSSEIKVSFNNNNIKRNNNAPPKNTPSFKGDVKNNNSYFESLRGVRFSPIMFGATVLSSTEISPDEIKKTLESIEVNGSKRFQEYEIKDLIPLLTSLYSNETKGIIDKLLKDERLSSISIKAILSELKQNSFKLGILNALFSSDHANKNFFDLYTTEIVTRTVNIDNQDICLLSLNRKGFDDSISDIAELLKTVNKQNRPLFEKLFNCKEGEKYRFPLKTIVSLLKNVNEKNEIIFDKLVNDKNTDGKYRFSEFDIESLLPAINERNKDLFNRLYEFKENGDYRFRGYQISKFLQSVNNTNKELFERLITWEDHNKYRFKGYDIDKLLSIVTESNKELFERLVTWQNDKEYRFQADDIKGLLELVNKDNKILFERLLTEKEGKEYRFYDGIFIRKLLEIFNDKKNEHLLWLLDDKDGYKYRFSAYNIIHLWEHDDKLEQPEFKRLLTDKENNHYRFSGSAVQDILGDVNISTDYDRNLYNQLYYEILSGGSFRFNGKFLLEAIKNLKEDNKCYKLLYNAKDQNGNLRFSGKQISVIISAITALLMEKEGLSIYDEVDDEMKTKVYNKIEKLLQLKKLDNKLPNGDELILSLHIRSCSKKLNAKKLLQINTINQLSTSEKKDLLYILESFKSTLRLYNAEGNNEELEDKFPDFKNVKLPFFSLDDKGNINTDQLTASLFKDNRCIVKSKPVNNKLDIKNFYFALETLEDLFKSQKVDITKIGELKLLCSRENFITDVKNLLDGLSEEQANKITSLSGFELCENEIIKYPTCATLKEIAQLPDAKSQEIAQKLNMIIKRFTETNKVTIPEYPKLEESLNNILNMFPELYATIGKKQHKDHEHTLDIHTLRTLQAAVNDTRWNKELNDIDRKLATLAILFHDIGKPEGKVDKSHHTTSAQDTSIIIDKLGLSDLEKERVIDLIKNHHWTETINKPDMTEDEINNVAFDLAFQFRKPHDWQIANIFALSDLKASGTNVYELYKDVLDYNTVDRINNNVNYIQSSSIFLPQTRIPKASELNDVKDTSISSNDGTTNNKIVYLSDKTDLAGLGFDKDTTPASFRALAHIINPENKGFIQILNKLKEDPNIVLSTSYLSKDSFNIVFNNENFSTIGIVFQTDQNNIAAAYPQDMDSGRFKSLIDFKEYLFVNKDNKEESFLHLLAEKAKESAIYSKFTGNLTDIKKISDIKDETVQNILETLFKRRNLQRHFFASRVKESLKLSDSEYITKMGEIAHLSSPSQIKDEKLKNSIIETSNLLMDYHNAPDYKECLGDYTWNEALLCSPYPRAIITKNCKAEDIPFEFRKFAENNDLPIIIIKS